MCNDDFVVVKLGHLVIRVLLISVLTLIVIILNVNRRLFCKYKLSQVYDRLISFRFTMIE